MRVGGPVGSPGMGGLREKRDGRGSEKGTGVARSGTGRGGDAGVEVGIGTLGRRVEGGPGSRRLSEGEKARPAPGEWTGEWAGEWAGECAGGRARVLRLGALTKASKGTSSSPSI